MNPSHSNSLMALLAIILLAIRPSIAQESSSPDTLILPTSKHPGHGLFGGGFSSLRIQEISESDTLLDLIPEDISSPKLGLRFIDYKPFAYGNILRENPDYLPTFVAYNHPHKIDTANVPSEAENMLHIIVGTRGTDSVYIIDGNGNGDYRDDSVRVFENIIYERNAPLPDPVLCHYWIYNGADVVRDSGWVILGMGRDRIPKISVAQHLSAHVELNTQSYELQVMDWIPSSSFCFDSPVIGITSHNGEKKDSLLFSERLELGEYLMLGDAYYRFDDVANDGRSFTLVKEADVSDKVGKQVGFLAPDFNCVSIEGDSISLTDYADEFVLIVNITACWSEPMSYVHYKALSDKYLASLNMLAIDASAGPLQVNIEELGLEGTFVLSPENRGISEHYREDFCSRVCFLVDPSGHLVDKFEIHDWESALGKHFK